MMEIMSNGLEVFVLAPSFRLLLLQFDSQRAGITQENYLARIPILTLIGFEVRLENYVLDLGYEYFFATKVKISL